MVDQSPPSLWHYMLPLENLTSNASAFSSVSVVCLLCCTHFEHRWYPSVVASSVMALGCLRLCLAITSSFSATCAELRSLLPVALLCGVDLLICLIVCLDRHTTGVLRCYCRISCHTRRPTDSKRLICGYLYSTPGFVFNERRSSKQ